METMQTKSDHGAVAYLTTLPLDGADQIALWRAVSAPGRLWFERFGPDGWREDEQLEAALDATGTVRLTPMEARVVASECYGANW
jgi:hypothetical protein